MSTKQKALQSKIKGKQVHNMRHLKSQMKYFSGSKFKKEGEESIWDMVRRRE